MQLLDSFLAETVVSMVNSGNLCITFFYSSENWYPTETLL